MSAEDESRPVEQRPGVVDPHNVPVVFVDWFVTGGVWEEVVNVALGTVDHSMRTGDEDPARVVVASRLRLSREFALRLHRALGDILGLATGDEPKPEAPPSPPKNMIN